VSLVGQGVVGCRGSGEVRGVVARVGGTGRRSPIAWKSLRRLRRFHGTLNQTQVRSLRRRVLASSRVCCFLQKAKRMSLRPAAGLAS
jgi:hypothetical protein